MLDLFAGSAHEKLAECAQSLHRLLGHWAEPDRLQEELKPR